MRFFKPVSLVLVLCLLLSLCSASLAEDEIVSAPVDIEVGETESIGINGLFSEKESVSYNEVPSIEPVIANSVLASEDSDFVIDEDGMLIRYRGFDKNVDIPNGVKMIGQEAFAGDEIMESVNIPDTVTFIGYAAFSGCTKLKEIVIPDSVTDTNLNVLSGCTGLKKVQFSNQLKSINWAFCMDCSSLTTIEIPKSIESIDTQAFLRCHSLETITIPSSIKNIGSGAFSQCDSLKKVIISNSVQTIDEGAFSDCPNLEEITIPGSVTIIDRSAFNNSNNVVIRGKPGTYAERYAKALGIPFNAPIVVCDDKRDSNIYDDSIDDFVDCLIAYINQTRSIKVKQRPADLATTLKWSSSNTSIATVDQNGNVKGVAPGRATITAATVDGNGKSAQIEVLVPKSTEITFSKSPYWEDMEKPEVTLSEETEFYFDVSTPFLDETGIDMLVTCTSTDNSIVTVERVETTVNNHYSLRLKGHKLGKATITATTPDNGKTSFDVEVVRPDASSIKIDQSDMTMKVGESIPLTATITPAEADMSTFIWNPYDPTIVSVSKDGVVTALKEGWTTIYLENDNFISASIDVTVEPSLPTNITLNKTKATLGAKCTLTLKASLTPADTKTKLTWKSSDKSVAKVSQKGIVTAVKKGTATITVTAENGMTATAKITVKPAPKTITLYKSSKKLKSGATLDMKKGKSLTLVAKLPSGTLSTLTWSSDKPKIAKVSKTGKVTALKKGTSTITVKAANGVKAKVKIIVK